MVWHGKVSYGRRGASWWVQLSLAMARSDVVWQAWRGQPGRVKVWLGGVGCGRLGTAC